MERGTSYNKILLVVMLIFLSVMMQALPLVLAAGCGKCKTDADCRGCPATAACEKIILNGYCA